MTKQTERRTERRKDRRAVTRDRHGVSYYGRRQIKATLANRRPGEDKNGRRAWGYDVAKAKSKKVGIGGRNIYAPIDRRI